MGDALNDEEIARILAEDAMQIGVDPSAYYGDFYSQEDSSSDDDYGAPKKKPKAGGKKGGRQPKSKPIEAEPTAAAAAGPGPSSTGAVEFTETGRKRRKDTGATRAVSRAWTDEEERLFLEGLSLYGREWKKCAEHIGTRDHKAVTSHCQKWLIKTLLKAEELPPKMQESGRGYTLSGKPLDTNSSSARSYGIRPDKVAALIESGFLEIGVHITEVDPNAEPVPEKKSRNTGGGGEKKQQKQPAVVSQENGAGAVVDGVSMLPPTTNTNGIDTVNITEAAANTTAQQQPQTATTAVPQKQPLEQHQQQELFSTMQYTEPTEYAKNRPRRATARTKLGDTTESLDLTLLNNFVGPVGTGAPLAQPFSVTINKEAVLVMDFHAHLSRNEIIGLLGGCFDPKNRSLSITAAYPCRRAIGSDSSTSVELDAESQVEVMEAMEETGLIPVGWYHSHPIFEARPSQKDNENQRNYQALCHDINTGLDPWIGAIVGPYDQGLTSTASHFQMWVVRMQNGELTPYNVRATVNGMESVPSYSGHIERQLVTALEQLESDVGRVDLTSQWRPYARLVMGQPDGPKLTHFDKLRAALMGHLPLSSDPSGCSAFLNRVKVAIETEWKVKLPTPINTTTTPLVSPDKGMNAAVNGGGGVEGGNGVGLVVKNENGGGNDSNGGGVLQEQQDGASPVALIVPTGALCAAAVAAATEADVHIAPSKDFYPRPSPL